MSGVLGWIAIGIVVLLMMIMMMSLGYELFRSKTKNERICSRCRIRRVDFQIYYSKRNCATCKYNPNKKKYPKYQNGYN